MTSKFTKIYYVYSWKIRNNNQHLYKKIYQCSPYQNLENPHWTFTFLLDNIYLSLQSTHTNCLCLLLVDAITRDYFLFRNLQFDTLSTHVFSGCPFSVYTISRYTCPMFTTFIYHGTPLVSEECRVCSGMAVWPLYARECGTRRSSSWHPEYTEASDTVNTATPSTHPSHSSYGSCGLCRRCSASSFY